MNQPRFRHDNTARHSDEDLVTLNRIYEHRISPLDEEGRADEDCLQEIAENVLVDYDVLYLSGLWDLCVRDPVTGEIIQADLCDLRLVGRCDEAIIYLVEIPDEGYLPLVRYRTGEQFTPRDWQAGYTAIPDDLEEIDWVDRDGWPAVKVDGLPRGSEW